jgi:glucose/arabinose dehydrogenase
MRNILILGVMIAVAATLGFYFFSKINRITLPSASFSPIQNSPNDASPSSQGNTETPRASVIAQNLDTPWAIAFLPEGGMLVTERKGTVRLINSKGNLQSEPVATLDKVVESGEAGLLGIALHPEFSSNNYVYLYYTYGGSGSNTLNKVVRMKYEEDKLEGEQTIIDQIPGASNHNGGRIKFGKDKFLYITTGDAQEPSRSQDRNSLAGKILRVTDEGKAAPGNPFNSQIYSYGHRNPQGITWDGSGNLWETEHGPSGGSLGEGNDEVNRIESGKNYGWPEIQGDQTRSGMEKPLRHSGRSDTWAPGGVAFADGSIFFGGLRGTALYEAVLSGNQVTEFKVHFKGELGRIREVITGPDGMLYITTSNRDGRGIPKGGDDKIIRVNPQKL